MQFVRYEGTDVGGAVLDEQEIRANVINAAERLEIVLKGHLHTRLVEVSGFREEPRPNYPFDALREVCMNAIMHRNYERPADGALGSMQTLVQRCYHDFKSLSEKLLERLPAVRTDI